MSYKGRLNKNDEYYTTYESIENFFNKCDLNSFENRTIYCNCDDYRWSNFTKYFKNNFEELKLKKLISTNYDIGEGAYIYTYDGKNEIVNDGIEDGSFERYDYIFEDKPIVVTNPPFSIYKSYIYFLEKHNADFVIVGTLQNTCNFYSNEFLNNISVSRENISFYNPNYEWINETRGINGSIFVTNTDILKRNNSKVKLTKTFNEIDKKYSIDGYLLLKKCKDIPIDYYEPMLVPISFINVQPEIKKMFKILNNKFILPKGTFRRLMIKRI